MKNILVAMDFSPESVNALEYARKMNENSILTVVHIKQRGLEFQEPVNVQSILNERRITIEKMREFISDRSPDLDIDNRMCFEIEYGSKSSKIVEFAKSNFISEIYLGLKDVSTIRDKIFGSTSFDIIKSSHFNVYLIPAEAKFEDISHAIVPFDENIVLKGMLDNIKKWDTSKTFLKFLHVAKGESEKMIQEKDKIVLELLNSEDIDFGFTVESRINENVCNTILSYAYNQKADLIIVPARTENFLKRFVYKSYTKDFIKESKIPLLFIHSN